MTCNAPYLKVRSATVWTRTATWLITEDPHVARNLTNRTIEVKLTRDDVELPMQVTKVDAVNGVWAFGPADIDAAPVALGMWTAIIDWEEDGLSDRSSCDILVEKGA